MKTNFIKTTDVNTAQKLIELGFQQISCVDDCHVFINKGQINFEKNNISKENIIFTNTLFL